MTKAKVDESPLLTPISCQAASYSNEQIQAD